MEFIVAGVVIFAIFVLGLILAVSGCANQPAFCPEIKVTFCPTE